ncbi:secreted protein [Mycobacterium tuberculosis MAL020167]|nr:secreted protein [Mycobacterium tuberculosis MAL020167]
MKGTKLAVVVGMTVAAVSLAAPAQADDYDAPFNNTIHRFGIYGPQETTTLGLPRSAANG